MRHQKSIILFISLILFSCTEDPQRDLISYPKWSKIELDFTGPSTREAAGLNPFTNYRLDVVFTNGDNRITVPGFYAADGQSAETSADSGRVWRVRFRPPLEGEWSYSASLKSGINVVYAGPNAKASDVPLENASGKFLVIPPPAAERGRLIRQHPRYLQWAESGQYFLKGGADSPENLLAYAGFDGTYRYEASSEYGEAKVSKESLHRFAIHEKDWQVGDADWQNGKGKGLIGALNYIAERGVNAIYFLSMNIGGDGKDVWPYTNENERFRFDVSKLAQWEKVFDYADDSLGMMLHFVLGETENETLLDGGEVGPQRRLYYRELLARFGHHRAITWNLGEENGPNDWSEGALTTQQQKNIAAWWETNDPFKHYVTVHTHPNRQQRRRYFGPLVGARGLDGLSVQIDQPQDGHEATRFWLDTTASVDAPWIVCIDEIGPWWRGLDPDHRTDLNNQDSVRALVLWGNLMAGGGGVEWYFGGRQAQNDLNAEDWTAYDRAWRWTGHALDFFQQHLPFAEMEAADELVKEGQFCLAKPGEIYAVYLPFGGPASIDLSGQNGTYSVRWYDPSIGGDLRAFKVAKVSGGSQVDLGNAPDAGDWAILIKKE